MAARNLIPNTTSSATFFRALLIASSARSCPHLPRTYSSQVGKPQSSKRELYTAPAYQPHSFPDLPPPPRNTGVSDASIAGPQPQINGTRPPDVPRTYQLDKKNESIEVASISVPERAAQKSTSVPQQSTTATETKPKPRRSKLKARKAVLTISPTAVEHLRELLSDPTPKMIRVGTKNRGCSGLAYHLEYVEKPGKFDEVVEQEGVKVLIDSKALFSIIGSEMDWQEDQLSAKFVFKNPNITEQCGCGESFSIS